MGWRGLRALVPKVNVPPSFSEIGLADWDASRAYLNQSTNVIFRQWPRARVPPLKVGARLSRCKISLDVLGYHMSYFAPACENFA
jgi:hypothetical protein